MVALPSVGEFNRVDRSGDQMEGDLQFYDITNPTYKSIVEFLQTIGGPLAAGVRLNGNDLEFYDSTLLAWVTLSSLSGQIGDIAHFTAAPGQTVFNLPFSYNVGANTLQMFIGGLRVPGATFTPTPVYVETNPTTVTLNAVAPWTPLAGGELIIFYVAGRPNVMDTYTVKGDALDASPNYLPNKLAQAGAVQITTIGSPANTQAQIDVPLATAAPPASAGVGAPGTATDVARQDHQHPAPTAILGSLTPLVESGAGAVGVATVASREDHVHPLGPVTPLGSAIPIIEGVGAAGVSTNASREDHVHPASGGAGAATFLYEEQTHPGGAGPTHLITLTTGAYVPLNNELNVIVGGVVVPRSNIQELTTTTFNIINWGPIAVNTAIVALVPKAVAGTGLTNALYEIQVAGAGQTIFTLTTGTYRPGFNEIQVYIGTSFIQNTAFTETSPTVVTMNAPGAGGPPAIPAGTPVLFMVPQGAVSGGTTLLGTDAASLNLATTGAPQAVVFANFTYPVGTKEIKILATIGNVILALPIGLQAIIDLATGGNELTAINTADAVAANRLVVQAVVTPPVRLYGIAANEIILSTFTPGTRNIQLTAAQNLAPGSTLTYTAQLTYRG